MRQTSNVFQVNRAPAWVVGRIKCNKQIESTLHSIKMELPYPLVISSQQIVHHIHHAEELSLEVQVLIYSEPSFDEVIQMFCQLVGYIGKLCHVPLTIIDVLLCDT